ncbi:hypothetical protein LVJ94_29265 [Pendulispora rubella]|uniref:Uncharacterized protein n=1 Tax=Pendulispora rubella TaxID=2741070 RepID=A0ABZ2KQN8_9BACT
MRAGVLQESFDWIDELQPHMAAAIRENCDPKQTAVIGQATRLVWVPLEYGIGLSTAVHSVLGDAGLLDLGREAILRSGNRTWLRPFRDAAVSIFGYDPRGIFRFTPRGWNMIFGGCGELTFASPVPGTGTLILGGFPPLVSDPMFLKTIQGAFWATLDFCKVQGEVFLRPLEPGGRTCTFDIAWTPREP